MKIHVAGLSLSRDLELHLGREAYVGLAGVGPDRVNLCGLFRRRRISAPGADLIFHYLEAAGLAALAARIRAASADPSSFCAVAAVDFDRRVPAPATVTLGDACAMVPPFTGNGMAMAFQSAEVALNPLLGYARGDRDWPQTCHSIHDSLRRRFRFRLASAHLLHPYLWQPDRQRLLSFLDRAHLVPFRPLYAALH